MNNHVELHKVMCTQLFISEFPCHFYWDYFSDDNLVSTFDILDTEVIQNKYAI